MNTVCAYQKIHFYLNGRESDARLGTGTQSPLEYKEVLKKYGMEPFTIGYSKSPYELFFKGYISDIKLWDRCLDKNEIKNLHKETPDEGLLFNFDFDNEIYDLGNVEIVKEKIEIPHTILPYRRNGKFYCLPHQTEGLIKVGGIDRWAKGETTAANERRYVLQMQQGRINYKEDGINSMEYEFISIDTIYNKHKMINVKS
mgnify:CR=1 FL=1